MKTKRPLWANHCFNESETRYFCKCKICKSAIDHANHLADVAMIDNVFSAPINGHLTDDLMRELI